MPCYEATWYSHRMSSGMANRFEHHVEQLGSIGLFKCSWL